VDIDDHVRLMFNTQNASLDAARNPLTELEPVPSFDLRTIARWGRRSRVVVEAFGQPRYDSVSREDPMVGG
jgi:hypothetical protein